MIRSATILKTAIFLAFVWIAGMPLTLQAQDDTEMVVVDYEVDEPDSYDYENFYAIPNWYTLGRGIRFTSSNQDYSMRITGYVQPQYERYSGKDTLGNSYGLTRYRMSRARIKIYGASAKTKLSYRISFDLSRNNSIVNPTDTRDDDNNFLWDAFVTYRPWRYTRFHVGQKAPRTNYREFFITSNTLQLVERSRITSLFSVFRDVGLFIDHRQKIYRDLYVKSYLEITTGEGQNSWTNYGGLKYGGRVDILPMGLFQGGEFNGVDMIREWKPKLVIGGAYSYIDGMTSRNGNARTLINQDGQVDRFLYQDASGNQTLPDYMKFIGDFMIKYRGITVLGAYVKTTASVPSTITTPEGTVRGRMNLGEIWNIQAGYLMKGDWSIDARYEKINDLTRLDAASEVTASTETFLDASIYNRPNYYTIGLTKYNNKYAMKIQSSLTYNKANVDTGAETRIHSINNPSGQQDINVSIPDEFTFRLLFSIAF